MVAGARPAISTIGAVRSTRALGDPRQLVSQMTPRDETFVKRWALARARGMWHYVLVSGVIAWGVPMFFVMTYVVSKPPNLTPGLLTGLAALWATGGLAFGVSVWLISEKRYKRLAPPDNRQVTNTAARPAASQSVLVYLSGTKLPSEVYEKFDLATLEDQLSAAIAARALGEFDGNEVGPGETKLYMYGPDAEQLFAGIEPILRGYPLCKGAKIVIRKGGPGAGQREIVL